MNPKQLLSDDDAVSPVIGVILMVAITVILAAVIATFVLGLGDQVSNTAPQASFSFDYDASLSQDWDNGEDSGSVDGDGTLNITHDGGDSIEAGNLYIRGSQDDGAWGNDITDRDGDIQYDTKSEINAGRTLSVNVANSDTVRVVYEDPNGGSTATIGRWEGPEA
ncbi:type IV pilin N-terminal domain-containing protein [Halomicroarcula sp. GCM10025817]|uniref:type IV pilin N-terminal domain-containing protein n=1 Tax=Haloarcula TaxID=2237 RepID=UPI0023E8545D|nr:type IV pilin N-terminal domain-containing protein [Halomicroarcula sp. SYNS111]